MAKDRCKSTTSVPVSPKLRKALAAGQAVTAAPFAGMAGIVGAGQAALMAQIEEMERSERRRMREMVEVDDLLAPPYQRQAEIQSSKTLIAAEVQRRVAAGERYGTITELSVSLRQWMKAVHGRSLAARSIEHRLRELGLFPKKK